jgi:2,3-bisphosphoglycerate-independent phosphoglycerate mutase
MPETKGVILAILDGWGVGEDYEGNAITRANTPYYDSLVRDYPNTTLSASGLAIGLPEGQIGTSEVNHMIIGAGKILYQDLTRINLAIKDGSFRKNKVLTEAASHVNKTGQVMHILGLVGSGGVHSHQDHLLATIKLALDNKVPHIMLHLLSDGRDLPPSSFLEYYPEIKALIESNENLELASLSGRYYGMDRDHNWARTKKTLDALLGSLKPQPGTLEEVVTNSYNSGTTDEFFVPVRFKTTFRSTLGSGDSLVFVNFRSDRTRQLTQNILAQDFDEFYFATMTQYEPSFKVHIAFPMLEHGHTLGEALSKEGLTQYRITETEKFAHLTYFFNCKREDPYEGEKRIMLDSYNDIKTHDQKPYMKAREITEAALDVIKREAPPAIMLNLCNADMVGHSGNIPAIIEGVETIDQCLAKLVPEALKSGYAVLITADHGNAEQKIDKKTGGKLSAHTLNPVPYIQVTEGKLPLSHKKGQLKDIAPTILTLLDQKIPSDMTGISFIERK